jgi:hypothetical protein
LLVCINIRVQSHFERRRVKSERGTHDERLSREGPHASYALIRMWLCTLFIGPCVQQKPTTFRFHAPVSGLLNSLQSRYVVWLTKLIGDVLDVDDAVVAIKHKDGPL